MEKNRALPGDELLPQPLFSATHAITIAATPDQVWPWLAQMGAGRAGWYSWDVIDNGGQPSATSLVPSLQAVAAGDILPAVPGARDAFVVAVVDPPRDLVLTVRDGRGGPAVAWQHHLDPLEDGRTRLIARARASVHWLDSASSPAPATPLLLVEHVYIWLARLPRPLLKIAAAAGHRVMQSRQLRGIARRCEAAAGVVHAPPARRLLLVCGILSSLLYGGMIGLIRFEGYSRLSQTPSELTAIGAPTREVWMALGAIYTVLFLAFAWEVWRAAGRARMLRLVGGLLLAFGGLGLLWPLAPMHPREILAAGGGTVSDDLHVALSGVTVVLMFLAITAGAAAFGSGFRRYSIATIVVLVAFGALTFGDAPRLQANLPTPWIGLYERVNISVFLLWIVVLAARLWRTGRPTTG